MPIDMKMLKECAAQARLELAPGRKPSDEETLAALEKMAAELNAVVGAIDVLAQAETEGVEPLYALLEEVPGEREDVAVDSGLSEQILDQAPDRVGDFFAVPKII